MLESSQEAFEGLGFFAVSKQISIVYSADCGPAEINMSLVQQYS